jgi:hypothetical protein
MLTEKLKAGFELNGFVPERTLAGLQIKLSLVHFLCSSKESEPKETTPKSKRPRSL